MELNKLKTYYRIIWWFREGSKGYTKEQFIYASKLCSQSSVKIKERYDILVKRYFWFVLIFRKIDIESEIQHYASIINTLDKNSPEIGLFKIIFMNLYENRNFVVRIIQAVDDILLSIDKSKIILDTSAICVDTISIASAMKLYILSYSCKFIEIIKKHRMR